MLSLSTVNLIKLYEGLRLHPYRDTTGTPTIGYGATYYEDNKKVTMDDSPITDERAIKLLNYHLTKFATNVKELTKKPLNSNQFGALVSFAYNVGLGALKKSTLLQKVNANPNDATIEDEFNKYVFSKGKKLNGLVKRRQSEYDYYKKKTNLIIEIMQKMKMFITEHKKSITVVLSAVAVLVIGIVTFNHFKNAKK